MPFALRVLAACWIVGTTADIARADKITVENTLPCASYLLGPYLLMLSFLAISFMVKKRWLQHKTSTKSENAHDDA